MRRNSKSIYIVLIMLVLISVTIGYAVINSTLNITGKSSISKNSWDIHFDNIVVKEGSVETVKTPVVENSTKVDFEVSLNLPGDFYEFTVDVVNNGTIDGMIDSINKTPDLTTQQQKYFNYVIEYENGDSINTKQLVKFKNFVRIKIRVEYKSDITAFDLPQNDETLNLGFTVNYVQNDGSGNSVRNNGAAASIIAYGDIDSIGTIVEIGTEKFYVFGTEGNNVKLLSMYNLYVGGEYNWNTNKWTAYGDEATGMQDSNMLGENYRSTIASGVTAYSSVSSEYNGSIVEGYVNNYKDLLEYNFDVDIVDARLAVIDEFVENAGCIFDDIYEPVLCEDAYSFVKQTVFWTSSIAEDVNRLYYYDLDRFTANREYYDKEIAGVRPVIIVSRNDIIVDNDPYASGSLDDIGTIVSFGDQYFYTIGSDKDNVKLLSMYNLDVGNEVTYIDFDGDGSVIMNPLQNPTGIQKHNMMGFKILTFPYYGTIAFSNVSSDYNGSLAELHVNNYKSYLETKNNIVIKEARLMSYEENDFFCVENNNLCDSLPNFLFFGSYWIDVPNGDKLLAIGNGGMVLYPEYYVDYLFGIRPVIIVSKDYFK